MIAYHHAIIAHGKAIAECLSERRPLGDAKYRQSFTFVENAAGRWNLILLPVSKPVAVREGIACTESSPL